MTTPSILLLLSAMVHGFGGSSSSMMAIPPLTAGGGGYYGGGGYNPSFHYGPLGGYGSGASLMSPTYRSGGMSHSNMDSNTKSTSNNHYNQGDTFSNRTGWDNGYNHTDSNSYDTGASNATQNNMNSNGHHNHHHLRRLKPKRERKNATAKNQVAPSESPPRIVPLPPLSTNPHPPMRSLHLDDEMLTFLDAVQPVEEGLLPPPPLGLDEPKDGEQGYYGGYSRSNGYYPPNYGGGSYDPHSTSHGHGGHGGYGNAYPPQTTYGGHGGHEVPVRGPVQGRPYPRAAAGRTYGSGLASNILNTIFNSF